MTDSSTHDTYTQNIQNNAVISVTTVDPMIATEAMRITEAMSAELSATRLAAHQSVQEAQNMAAQERYAANVATAGLQQQVQGYVASTQQEVQNKEA